MIEINSETRRAYENEINKALKEVSFFGTSQGLVLLVLLFLLVVMVR
jgi:hypothetical protein